MVKTIAPQDTRWWTPHQTANPRCASLLKRKQLLSRPLDFWTHPLQLPLAQLPACSAPQDGLLCLLRGHSSALDSSLSPGCTREPCGETAVSHTWGAALLCSSTPAPPAQGRGLCVGIGPKDRLQMGNHQSPSPTVPNQKTLFSASRESSGGLKTVPPQQTSLAFNTNKPPSRRREG